MLEKLRAHLENSFPFLHGKKILVAISGGLDSVVLAHILQALGYDLSLAHCNFQLREQASAADEYFVKTFGKTTGILTETIRFDTEKIAKEKKQSTQVIARNLRYAWFEEVKEKHALDYIATAHHADDNLETFLINLSRGTGLDGLTGIPAINKSVVRPLLPFSREEIFAYATKHQLSWREDQSNTEIKYLRNAFRHKVLPVLKEINPQILNAFSKTTSHLQESQQLITDHIKTVKSSILQTTTAGTIHLNIADLLRCSKPKAYAYQLLKEYGFTEWNDIENLLTAQAGKQVFSKTHRLVKDRDVLLLTPIKKQDSKEQYSIALGVAKITTPIILQFTPVSKETSPFSHSICVDKKLLKFPLHVRKWEKGDYFYPSGMHQKKKLSKFFKDEKMSLLEKEAVWVLCSETNDIIWLINKRQDNRFIVHTSTQEILKITC